MVLSMRAWSVNTGAQADFKLGFIAMLTDTRDCGETERKRESERARHTHRGLSDNRNNNATQ